MTLGEMLTNWPILQVVVGINGIGMNHLSNREVVQILNRDGKVIVEYSEEKLEDVGRLTSDQILEDIRSSQPFPNHEK